MKTKNYTKYLLSVITIALALCLSSCSKQTKKELSLTEEEQEMVSYGEIGYADIVSFIVQGFQSKWEQMNPEDQGLSSVYKYCSPDCGFAQLDINGDGIKELLIGDQFENGSVNLYDIYSINPKDGSLYHLASGGERDWYTVNHLGILIEHASNSAFDSYEKGWEIKNGKLEKIKADAWEETLMKMEMEKFSELAGN